jgi:hypothetical protein
VKRTPSLVLGLLGMVILSVSFPIILTTTRGQTAWYFLISSATFTANGKATRGQLHRNLTGRTLLFTHETKETGKYRTYLLGFADRKTFVKSCGDWAAERQSLIISRTIPPPCSFLDGSASSPQIGKNYLSFVDDFGEKMEARW